MNKGLNSQTIQFEGKTSDYYGIWIVNILLSIITLGVYSAWATVRTKQFFLGNLFLSGDSFNYHAKPMQILKGRIIAILCIVAFVVLSHISPVASFLMMVVFYLAIPWILWSNTRFNSAMTSFRNTRFSFQGTLKEAYKVILGKGLIALIAFLVVMAVLFSSGQPESVTGVVFAVIICGFGGGAFALFLLSWVVSGIYNYFINNFKFGDYSFSALVELKKVFIINVISIAIIVCGIFVIGIFSASKFHYMLNYNELSSPSDIISIIIFSYVTILICGVFSAVYATVAMRNYIFSNLSLSHFKLDSSSASLTFSSTLQTLPCIFIMVTNLIMFVFSCGLAFPYTHIRVVKYFARNTSVIGDVDGIGAVSQESSVKSAVGEELASSLDIDLGIL